VKTQLADLVRDLPLSRGRNLAREYLQAQILGSLQRSGAMIPLAFRGGTALRFLYGIDRFSEDLDFALERNPADYDFKGFLESIRTDLEAQAYAVELKVDDHRVVHSAFVRFPGLLFELGLSAHRSEVIAVKLEVDTRPPEGAGLATTLVRRHVLLNIQHHDRASLLAGKLHAILQRAYLKGRDVYDLVWYLSDPGWPPPNLVLLNNALAQTGWDRGELMPGNWKEIIRSRFEGTDWEAVRRDVRPFLEREADLALVSERGVLGLLNG
jgi:hypothetical protein